MPSQVHRFVGVANTEQTVADSLHRLLALPLRGNGERERHRQIREPTIRHEEMPQAETMHSANKEIGRLAQAQPLQTTRQLTCAFLTVGDTRRSSWRAHILCHDPGKLQHQRLGLAAAWPGQHHAVAYGVISRLLTRIADKIRRLGEICRADTTQRHRGCAPAPAGCNPDRCPR